MDSLQLTLQLSADLPRKHKSLRRALSVSIYAFGLDEAAALLDERSSRVGENLAGFRGKGENANDVRLFDIDDFERYMEKSGDLMPLHYLIAKFLPTPEARQTANMARIQTLAKQLVDAMGDAEVVPTPVRKRGGR